MTPKVLLSGILIGCPFGVPAQTCPLLHLRGLPAKARMRWLAGLSTAEQIRLIEHHRRCSERREQAAPVTPPDKRTPARDN